MSMIRLENDPTGNKAIIDALVEGRAQFPPRAVDSVVSIFGGFGKSRILIDEQFTGELRSVNANGSFSVSNGSPDQSARYVFGTDNGHGLSAEIFGDGKIVVTLLSQGAREIETDFDGLVEQLNIMNGLDSGPYYRGPKV
jgi:hypothetical protein